MTQPEFESRMALSPLHSGPKTFVLLDPTSDDGETSLDLLESQDHHTSLVVLLHDRSSHALHTFADAEEVDLSTAASIYLDQVADRIASSERIVETIVVAGFDPAVEIRNLVAFTDTRRVLVPASLARLQPNSYRRLTQGRPSFVVVAPAGDEQGMSPARRGSTDSPRAIFSKARRIPSALRALPFADQVPASELRNLDKLGTIVDVAAHTTVIRRGAFGRQFLVVIDGVLTVERDGVFVADLGQGQIAGEMALLTGSRCNASVTAASDATVLAMNRREFATLLDCCPGIARQVMQTAIGRMASAA